MPITRGEFESGEPDPTLLLTEFLRVNVDVAYTVKELREHLETRGVSIPAEEVGRALSLLEGRERVQSKVVLGVLYYVYRKTIGFRPA